MADINSTNRKLFIMKYERDKYTALAQVHSKNIRILELEEEIERCRKDMEEQKKIIATMESNVAQQQELMKQELVT